MPPARTHFCDDVARGVGARLLPREDVLELHHAGVREHAASDRCAARAATTARSHVRFFEEVEKRSADFADARHLIAFGTRSWRAGHPVLEPLPPRRAYPSGIGALDVKRLRRFLPRSTQLSSRKPTRSGGYPGPSDGVIEVPARPAGAFPGSRVWARHSPRASGMTDIELGLTASPGRPSWHRYPSSGSTPSSSGTSPSSSPASGCTSSFSTMSPAFARMAFSSAAAISRFSLRTPWCSRAPVRCVGRHRRTRRPTSRRCSP